MYCSRCIVAAVFVILVLGVPVAAQESAKEAFPDDAWIQSLPTEPIAAGNLDLKWGPLARAAEGADAGGAIGGGGAAEDAGAGQAGAAPSSDAGILAPAATGGGEAEENNSFGKAQRVGVSARMTGAINPVRDVDAYSFEAPRRGNIAVRFSGLAANLNVTFRMHNWDNQAITAWLRPKISGGATDAEIVDLPEAGRYYIYVADHDGKAESAAYTIEWIYHSGDRFEPNESLGTATPINANDSVAISTNPRGDYDCFMFEVENQGIATVEFLGVPDNLELTFRAHNGDRQAITGWLKPSVRDGATMAEIVDLPSAGKYFLVVAEHQGDVRANEAYTLKLTTHLGDGNEPNRSFGVATRIEATGQVSANLLPKGDMDHFYFDVKNQGVLEVSFGGVPEDISVVYRLYNAEGQALTGWGKPRMDGGASETIVLDLPGPGRYYLAFGDEDGDGRAAQSMTMQTRYVPGDEHEPNASLGRATTIALGTAVSANLLPLRDYDHYVFEVGGEGTLDARITGVAKEFAPSLRFFNAELSAISGWVKPKIADGATEAATVEFREPGQYYIAVTDDSGKNRVSQRYSLTVNLR